MAYPLNSTQKLSVSDLRFTQTSIAVHFSGSHELDRIDDAVRTILANHIGPDTFPILEVMHYQDILWSFNNRRLWVFKKARVAIITVLIVPPDRHPKRFQNFREDLQRNPQLMEVKFFPAVRGRCQKSFAIAGIAETEKHADASFKKQNRTTTRPPQVLEVATMRTARSEEDQIRNTRTVVYFSEVEIGPNPDHATLFAEVKPNPDHNRASSYPQERSCAAVNDPFFEGESNSKAPSGAARSGIIYILQCMKKKFLNFSRKVVFWKDSKTIIRRTAVILLCLLLIKRLTRRQAISSITTALVTHQQARTPTYSQASEVRQLYNPILGTLGWPVRFLKQGFGQFTEVSMQALGKPKQVLNPDAGKNVLGWSAKVLKRGFGESKKALKLGFEKSKDVLNQGAGKAARFEGGQDDGKDCQTNDEGSAGNTRGDSSRSSEIISTTMGSIGSCIRFLVSAFTKSH